MTGLPCSAYHGKQFNGTCIVQRNKNSKWTMALAVNTMKNRKCLRTYPGGA